MISSSTCQQRKKYNISVTHHTANANRSMEEKEKDDRKYTYSELGRLMKVLEEL